MSDDALSFVSMLGLQVFMSKIKLHVVQWRQPNNMRRYMLSVSMSSATTLPAGQPSYKVAF